LNLEVSRLVGAGTGADERDLLGLADALDPRFAVASLRAPLPIGQGFRWFQGMSIQPEERAIEQSIGESSDKVRT
jgi:predicted esterase